MMKRSVLLSAIPMIALAALVLIAAAAGCAGPKVESGQAPEDVAGQEPGPESGAGSGASSGDEAADNRGAYLFDLAITNRFDYVPEFEEGKAPSQSPDYLYYAFILNLEEWNKGNKFLTAQYVEDIITSHFEMDEDAIVHRPSRDWNFDGKVYTVARPGSYAYEPVYGLKEFDTYEEGGRTVYDVLLEQYSLDEFAYQSVFEYALPTAGGSGTFSPSMQFVIDKKGERIRSGEVRVWEAIREMIAEGDTKGFTVSHTERFKYYVDAETRDVVFLEHTSQ